MPLLTALRLCETNLRLWQMTESPDELEALTDSGARLRKEAELQFSREHRRREWLLPRIMLKRCYGEQYEIDYLPCGKPILKNGAGHISISHTGDYLALAFSEKRAIGLDIEQWSPRALRLSERFLFPEERTTSESEATALWSAKEAVFKLTGDAYRTVAEVRLECVQPSGRYRVVGGQHESITIGRIDFPSFVLTLATYSS